jgi:predicted CopG family antitoxin
MSSTKLKHIVVDEQNYLKLKRRGCAAESFNDVITRLLEEKQGTKEAGR